jgi:hypothetical protein
LKQTCLTWLGFHHFSEPTWAARKSVRWVPDPDPARAFPQIFNSNLNSTTGRDPNATKIPPTPNPFDSSPPLPLEDAAGGGRAGAAAHPAASRPRRYGRCTGDVAIAAAGVPARLQRRPARARSRPRRGPRCVRPPPLPRRLACASLGGPAAQPPQPQPGHGPLPQLHQARI